MKRLCMLGIDLLHSLFEDTIGIEALLQPSYLPIS